MAVSADALVERIAPVDRRPPLVELDRGAEPGFDAVVELLAAAGYERVDTVEERGSFSVRGGLVDVFPTTGREPMRAEFFGDEIERLSAFSAFTQRSLRELDRAVVYPAAEPGDLEQRMGRRGGRAGDPGRAGRARARAGAARRRCWSGTPSRWRRPPASTARRPPTGCATRMLRSRGYVRPQEVEALVERSGALEEMPLGQPHSFEAQPPALASFGIAEAENELRALVRAGYRVLVCFPHLGEAERTRLALTRIEVETAASPARPGRDEAGRGVLPGGAPAAGS